VQTQIQQQSTLLQRLDSEEERMQSSTQEHEQAVIAERLRFLRRHRSELRHLQWQQQQALPIALSAPLHRGAFPLPALLFE
jgi:hypothetical protein